MTKRTCESPPPTFPRRRRRRWRKTAWTVCRSRKGKIDFPNVPFKNETVCSVFHPSVSVVYWCISSHSQTRRRTEYLTVKFVFCCRIQAFILKVACASQLNVDSRMFCSVAPFLNHLSVFSFIFIIIRNRKTPVQNTQV